VLGKVARSRFDSELFIEDILANVAASWDLVVIDDLRLAKGTAVFATFEHPGGAPRDDAPALAQALALPTRTDEALLIELSYPTKAVNDTRFPTVADAGLMPRFRPAPEVEPSSGYPETCCGWTEPLGAQPPQPELVHANAALTVLDRPPRLVGRVPP
jgi:hypothetical protein